MSDDHRITRIQLIFKTIFLQSIKSGLYLQPVKSN